MARGAPPSLARLLTRGGRRGHGEMSANPAAVFSVFGAPPPPTEPSPLHHQVGSARPPRSRRLPSAHAASSVPSALSSSPPSASREPSPSLEKRRRTFRRARTRAASSSAPRPPGAVWVVWAVEAAARLPGRVPCGEEEEGEEQPAPRQRSADDSSRILLRRAAAAAARSS